MQMLELQDLEFLLLENSMLSILIPHKRGIKNDLALQLNVQMLLENTVNQFELLVDTMDGCPYRLWNEMARKAKYEILVFSNSDVLMSKGWDSYIPNYVIDNNITTGYLVEPGIIGVFWQNITKNFGMSPEDFNRLEFEKFAISHTTQLDEVRHERAWYMPCFMKRDWFLGVGGFDIENPFPYPNDEKFWNDVESQYDTIFLRIPSIAYHFQNLTGRDG